jgi:hypothetical protein
VTHRNLACLFLLAPLLLADGGSVLMRTEKPPYVVTVFASPTPPRVGAIDLSVLVQSGESLDPVLDADVRVRFSRNGSETQAVAIHDQAQNKLLYATTVDLPESGEWHYDVTIGGQRDTAPIIVPGVIRVMPSQPGLSSYWIYLTLPFFCLLIFSLHQWLRFGRQSSLA